MFNYTNKEGIVSSLFVFAFYCSIFFTLSACNTTHLIIPKAESASHLTGVALTQISPGIIQAISYNHLPCEHNCLQFDFDKPRILILNKNHGALTFKIDISENLNSKFNSYSNELKNQLSSNLSLLLEQLENSYTQNLFNTILPVSLEITLVDLKESINHHVISSRNKDRVHLNFFLTTPTKLLKNDRGVQKISLNIANILAHELAHIAVSYHQLSSPNYISGTINDEARGKLFASLFSLEALHLLQIKPSFQASILLKLDINVCKTKFFNNYYPVNFIRNFSYTDNRLMNDTQIGYKLGLANLANLYGSCKISIMNEAKLKKIKSKIKHAFLEGHDFRKTLLILN